MPERKIDWSCQQIRLLVQSRLRGLFHRRLRPAFTLVEVLLALLMMGALVMTTTQSLITSMRNAAAAFRDTSGICAARLFYYLGEMRREVKSQNLEKPVVKNSKTEDKTFEEEFPAAGIWRKAVYKMTEWHERDATKEEKLRQKSDEKRESGLRLIRVTLFGDEGRTKELLALKFVPEDEPEEPSEEAL